MLSPHLAWPAWDVARVMVFVAWGFLRSYHTSWADPGVVVFLMATCYNYKMGSWPRWVLINQAGLLWWASLVHRRLWDRPPLGRAIEPRSRFTCNGRFVIHVLPVPGIPRSYLKGGLQYNISSNSVVTSRIMLFRDRRRKIKKNKRSTVQHKMSNISRIGYGMECNILLQVTVKFLLIYQDVLLRCTGFVFY